MKIHDEIDDWTAGALCGVLSPEEQQAFEQHLAECPHCRSLYEENEKMNTILNETLPELRPDQNFERRIIARFREKVAQSGFHPLRGLAWLMRFRVAQATFAVILLCAMVVLGAVLTGEYSFPSLSTFIAAHGQSTTTISHFYYGVPNSTVTSGLRSGSQAISANAIDSLLAGTTGTGSNAGQTHSNYLGSSTFRVSTGSIALNSNNTYTGTTGSAGGVAIPPAKFYGTVSDVKKLFAEADGFYETGRYDLAYKRSEQVLNIDPYNIAARKMQEKIDAARDQSALTAYNNTRGLMLWKTQKGWDWPVKKYQGREVPKIDIGKASVTDPSGSVTKLGNGTLTLSGSNTYTGGTTITDGKLMLGAGFSKDKQPVEEAKKSYVAGDIGFTVTNDYLSRGVLQTSPNAQETGGRRTVDESAKNSRLFAENGKLVQEGRIIKDHHSAPAVPTNPPIEQSADTHKLIRNAALEIEVVQFEKAVETIGTVAGEEQGYVNTQNSERGANGKLQGVIVVKILPANLDRFLLKLRTLGDLKNQTVGTEDVTKDYFDTEARIRNSKRTEEQLLEILKRNTNRVSDLLQVEKELARVRESIEQMQGQLKYYDALIAYATVTISLHEKDLSQAAAYLLKEHANLSLFAKDVEKAFADAKSAAESAKAQTVESHIQRDGDGRVTATLHLLFAPEVSDESISKLKALGRIQNFNSQTQRVARDGSGNSDVAKIERDKVELNLTIQQDEETAAQQTGMSVLTDHVEEKAAQIKEAAAKAGIEVKNAAFNRTANGEEIASLVLRMPMQKYPAFIGEVKSLGKVKDFTVSRRENAVAENAPAEITLQIFNQGNVVPDDSGLFATIRKTLGEGFGALMWSARMIGVSLAFIAPWAISLGLVLWLVLRRRGVKKL